MSDSPEIPPSTPSLTLSVYLPPLNGLILVVISFTNAP